MQSVGNRDLITVYLRMSLVKALAHLGTDRTIALGLDLRTSGLLSKPKPRNCDCDPSETCRRLLQDEQRTAEEPRAVVERRRRRCAGAGAQDQPDLRCPVYRGLQHGRQDVFIDRHLPRSFRWLMKTVRVEPFLLTHEIVEKALPDELRLHYVHAHQIACGGTRRSQGCGDFLGSLSVLYEEVRKVDGRGKAPPRQPRSRSHALPRFEKDFSPVNLPNTAALEDFYTALYSLRPSAVPQFHYGCFREPDSGRLPRQPAIRIEHW
jgi:hypothetical protein